MSNIWAVIPSAGLGKRMGTAVKKQFITLCGKELLVYTLEVFEKIEEIRGVVLVCGKDDIDHCHDLAKKYGLTKVKHVVEGAMQRQGSVFNGLNVLPKDCTMVVIHDGARPFVTPEEVRMTIEEADRSGACVLGAPVKDTIKIVDRNGVIERTPQRSKLWAAQTPQTFRYPEILDAYRRAVVVGDFRCTDDAQIVEKYMDMPIQMVQGSYENIKITTKSDLKIAEEIIRERETV